ncbi:MAG: indolepyruvate ferredoxin oxidoreductase family protein, partial [Novosphingobium sp.]|nr:indolepyruvate ferredoxin oxidoreductase family protein [Novosphingobium sp.]
AAFAAGCDEVLLIEEKRPLIEEQLAHLLYNLPAERRPRLSGKRDPDGAPLVSAIGELDPDQVAAAIAGRFDALIGTPVLQPSLDRLVAMRGPAGQGAPLAIRPASFCAGCPHNTSTVVPEGSIAFAGIGCHGMAASIPERHTLPFTQMGGEGAPWIGQAPFVAREHVFQNLGDGTYFHSGLLAIRACVAAGVNITYKILLNGAVGMTGGQPIEGERFEGEVTAPRVARQVASEGVGRVAVVSDDPVRFAGHGAEFPAGTSFHHRDELDAVQKELRDWRGVSVLIYDQSCATERRRLRKRGKVAPSSERLFIASEICEGCGDCGVQSNCIALEPLETEFGRKRRINQSVCNQDLSCLKGFCPSFVTVQGGKPRARVAAAGQDFAGGLPEPGVPAIGGGTSILVTGIGGSGVVTIGAILGMAAHLEGRGCSVLDMSGFAQRNGSVLSHIRLSDEPGAAIATPRIPAGGASLAIGCDPIVTAGSDVLAMLAPDTASVVLNRFVAPTSAFAGDPDFAVDATMLARRISGRVGADRVLPLDATRAASALLGDAIGANMMLVGFAWQRGLVPLSREAIEQALRLNGTAVAMNLAAFALGRVAAAEPDRFAALLGGAGQREAREPDTLAAMVESRVRHLAAYQDAALAERYRALIGRVAAAEAALGLGSEALALTVARTYPRLLAYKDEYEVARLLTGERFRSELDEAFGSEAKISLNLAPPLLARRDSATGRLNKRAFGPWILGPMKVLARIKRLRGTALDPFGYHPHRRRERALIGDYEALVEE